MISHSNSVLSYFENMPNCSVRSRGQFRVAAYCSPWNSKINIRFLVAETRAYFKV